MSYYPIDSARVGTFHFISVRPKTGPDGVQWKSREGVPQWAVNALRTLPPEPDGYQPKKSSEVIIVPAAEEPEVGQLVEVHFAGLVARLWETGERSAVYLHAESVQIVTGR